MKFINGMKDLSQAIVDKTVDVSQKSFKWVKDNRVEIIEYAAITILKSVVEVLNEDRNRKEIYENEYDYNESFESNINESSYISTINDEQVVLKEPQIKNNKNYPQNRKSPDCHFFHSKNGKIFVRGGTDEQKQQFREMHRFVGQYVCTECGNDFDEDDIDWEFSDPETGFYYCNFCSNSLEQAGIDAMDPDGFGYDDYGNWDSDRLGL